ncbi:MAG: CoA-binding protein [Gammaproteobacteria bacterium]|nr:CoA-binding protein [Gammaproteobacteria bacterium]
MQRLLNPATLAVFGGNEAAEVIRQCRRLGFGGDIWPVNPRKTELAGIPCCTSAEQLPSAPDASFVAVPATATVAIIGQLSRMGAGGAVCYAAGFAEVGDNGRALQQDLLNAAGDMPLIGPNCYGLLNYLDGAALWPGQQGGKKCARGAAIVVQSGNIGVSLTMQMRSLPIGYLISTGNQAALSAHDYIHALIEDPRVTTIGLHLEGIDDVAAFSQAALRALEKNIPLVAIKTGSSNLGAAVTLSHTSTLAGSDTLYSALFKRLGIARCHSLTEFVETLKFLCVNGALAGSNIASLSCSGGDASLVADQAEALELDMPPLCERSKQTLQEVLGDKVRIANPLDYHPYIWGQQQALIDCYTAMLQNDYDCTLLVLDYAVPGLCELDTWEIAEKALIQAKATTGKKVALVATLPESIPLEARERLLEAGIPPMQGLTECLYAIKHAVHLGAAQKNRQNIHPIITAKTALAESRGTGVHGRARRPRKRALATPREGLTAALDVDAGCPVRAEVWDEQQSKAALAGYGITIPPHRLCSAAQATKAAEQIGFPVVVKAVSSELVHKTEAGALRLYQQNTESVSTAVNEMAHLSDRFLVEKMVQNPVAEIIVGVSRDPQFGLTLLIGAGGIVVELLKDTVPLLLPLTRADITEALRSLKVYPLLEGFRGKPAGDIDAFIDTVEKVAAYALDHYDTLLELDINPLLVRPEGEGVVAVDALIKTLTRPPSGSDLPSSPAANLIS